MLLQLASENLGHQKEIIDHKKHNSPEKIHHFLERNFYFSSKMVDTQSYGRIFINQCRSETFKGELMNMHSRERTKFLVGGLNNSCKL